MRVVFRTQAEADLVRIVEWYRERAPDALPLILDDIYAKIDFLTRFPRTGVKVSGTPYHRAVTRQHHFEIAYEITAGALVIVGIFRFQDRET